MNIALIGYGKMGHAIEEAAKALGHTIVLKISSSNLDEFTSENIRKADVAIEFTRPEVARENVLKCLSAGVSVVCGTTGWNHGLKEAETAAAANNAAFLHASNFSVGVNIFFEVNKLLAKLMDEQEYDVQIEEVHHTQKKDAPSGTAISLAEQIVGELKRKRRWALNDTNQDDALPIIAHRFDSIPGTHRILYSSKIDDIEITHTAHNRTGFARGAVLAAQFIKGKSGAFSMKDVLGIN